MNNSCSQKTAHNYKSTYTLSLVAFFIGIYFLTGCSGEKGVSAAPKTGTSMTSLPGYTIRDSSFSRKDFNVWVVTTQLSFDSLFVNTTTTTKPNFDEQMVVAIKAQTENNNYKVRYKEMVISGRDLDVYFTAVKDNSEGEESHWVSVTAFPRNRTLRRVNFFHDNVLIRTVPVVIVY